jgi:hypothetical protein
MYAVKPTKIEQSRVLDHKFICAQLVKFSILYKTLRLSVHKGRGVDAGGGGVRMVRQPQEANSKINSLNGKKK